MREGRCLCSQSCTLLKEEVEQIERVMEDRLLLKEREEMMLTAKQGMKEELRKAVVISGSQGLGTSRSERMVWIRDARKIFNEFGSASEHRLI